MTGRFEGKVAVVTGAASGIGEATARLVVAEGGRVVVADVLAERGKSVAASLGDNAIFARCDVTDEASVSAAIDLAVSHFGRLDAVHANAGILGTAGPISDTPMVDWDRTMAVLARGVFMTVKHAARVLIAQGEGGAIVMTSSIAGIQGGLGPHAYSMAKAGIIGLAKSASAELVRHRIRVNTVAPTAIPTAMTAHLMMGDPDLVEATAKHLETNATLGRAASANDIAEAVLYLVSDAGSMISGQTLAIDAGLTTSSSTAPRWSGTSMIVARVSSDD